jgi:hypothetical protein
LTLNQNTFAWHKAGKHAVACLTVAVAGLLKLYPFILLPWFVWRGGRDSRARMRVALLVMVFCGLVVCATGPRLWLEFFRLGTRVSVANQIGRSFNFSVPALVINLGCAASDQAPLFVPMTAWWLTGLVLGLVIIGAAYLLCLRCAGDREIEFSLLIVSMLAAIVATQGHYFVLLIFPVTVAAVHVASKPTGWRVALFALLLGLGTYLGSKLSRGGAPDNK